MGKLSPTVLEATLGPYPETESSPCKSSSLFFFDLGPNFPLIACASALRVNMKSGRGSDLLRVYRDERNSFHACTHSIAYT